MLTTRPPKPLSCMFSMLLFSVVNYVFLLLRMFRSVYCVYVNVYCTTATGCQPNVYCTTATGCPPNVYCTTATGCQPNVYCTTATGCQPNVYCTTATGCQPNCS
jgi:hypothetical protein